MKKCPACGNDYADDVTLCPVDGQPLVPEGTGKGITLPSETAPNAFEVKLVSPIWSAGTYRVFVEKSDLIFIQLEGGSRSILDLVALLLGPFGGLVPAIFRAFAKRKAKARRGRAAGDPEVLLRESESNFKLNQAEIREAVIEAPATFGVSGKLGRLKLLVRHGEKIRCEFMSLGEMRRAIQLVVPLLNSTLKVNVKWNQAKDRFEKK